MVDYETVVQLIGSVKTSKGLPVMSKPDENIYGKGMKIFNEEMNEINVLRRRFHGEWNYVIKPH